MEAWAWGSALALGGVVDVVVDAVGMAGWGAVLKFTIRSHVGGCAGL
jgi:hypothetical protein